MKAQRGRRPLPLWLLMALLLFQGLSAIPSGAQMILDPSGGRLQIPVTWLQNSPFPNFLIPGLILTIGLGFGALFVLACLFFLPDWSWAQRLNPVKRQHWAWTAAVAFGLALMIWIVVQVLMIGPGTWLQPFYFAIGLAMVLLAFAPGVRVYLRA